MSVSVNVLTLSVLTLVGRTEVARNRSGPPVRRRILADQATHALADQVGVPGVAPVLLDELADQPAHADRPVVGVSGDELFEPAAVRQRTPQPRTGSFHGTVEEGVQGVGSVLGS